MVLTLGLGILCNGSLCMVGRTSGVTAAPHPRHTPISSFFECGHLSLAWREGKPMTKCRVRLSRETM